MTYWLRIENHVTVTYALRDEYLSPRADGEGLQQYRVTVNRTTKRMTVTQDEPPYQASPSLDAMRELLQDAEAGT